MIKAVRINRRSVLVGFAVLWAAMLGARAALPVWQGVVEAPDPARCVVMPDAVMVCERAQPGTRRKPAAPQEERRGSGSDYNLNDDLHSYCPGPRPGIALYKKPPGLKLAPDVPLLPEALRQCRSRRHCNPGLAEVQMLLEAQGFDPGPVDGLNGPRTRAAERAFICKHRLPPWYARNTEPFRRLLRQQR